MPSPPTRNNPTDPQALLAGLDADELRRRIEQLDRERSALLVLLRAARARQRGLARKGVADAG
jgi:hypothetical protein